MVASSSALFIRPSDRSQLERFVPSVKTEQHIAFRSRIILKAADGLSNHEIALQLDTSRPTVICWRKRYKEGGLQALCHDRPRGRSFASVGEKREVNDWVAKHPSFHFHFIPTSSSWLNLVERWFAEITEKQIRRGVFTSVAELEKGIYELIDVNNKNPKPFVWTKSAEEIINKANRGKALLETLL